MSARSARNRCSSAESFTPIQGRVPATCRAAMLPRVSAATSPRVRLQSREPSTSPCSAPRSFDTGETLPVQHETGFDVSTLRLPCVWRRTATTPRALPSIRLSQSSFFIDFDSGQWSAARACHPFIGEELVEDGRGLSAPWSAHSDLPHRCRA